jgi:maltose O-acetyltransferase
LGARVTVLPGVTVGSGCVIGASSLVTADTEPDCLYAGTPARLVRRLPA